MGPCAEVVGACIFNGKLYNAPIQHVNDAWLLLGGAAILVLLFGWGLIEAARAFNSWRNS